MDMCGVVLGVDSRSPPRREGENDVSVPSMQRADVEIASESSSLAL